MAIKPIYGMYVHDEETNTDGVAKFSSEELEDIRVGADGVTYSSAGSAVREQIAHINKDLNTVVEDVVGVNLFDGDFDESGYINTEGDQPGPNFKRTSKYYPIVGENKGIISIYLTEPVSPFAVFIYDDNKDYLQTVIANDTQTRTTTLNTNAKYFRIFTHQSFAGNATIALSVVTSYTPYEVTPTIKDNIIDGKNLTDSVQNLIGYYDVPQFITGIKDGIVTGFYLLDNSYTPYGISATSEGYGMRLKDGDGNVVANGYAVTPEFYSDKIQRFVDPATNEVVAYYILHYDGTDYAIESNLFHFTDAASSLKDNYLISKYLDRDSNLVLLGDSIFGYSEKNVLEALLAYQSDKQVFNCGFGGCQMSWRTNDGSNTYDPYSFVSVIDAIVEKDFTNLETNVPNSAYRQHIASLKTIDWSKPTTVFVNYINNDITADKPIGDLWDYTDEETDFDKQSVLGAFNYGVHKLLTAYPHVNIVQFTSAWRKTGPDALPPYAYTNALGKSSADYDNAIKENANRQGLSVYDFNKNGGRNWYNRVYYQVDNSHYNERGYMKFAKLLDALDKSYKG